MKSVKKNFLYNTFYQLLLILIPLITTPYVSRILGATGIGLYSYNYSIAYYFAMFAILGLNNYGNRTIAMVRDQKDELSREFWSIYAMQFMASIIVIFAYSTYIYYFNNETMGWIMLFYMLSTLFDINWFFFGLEEFKLTVTRNTIIRIITTFLIFVMIKTKNDIYLYALLMVLSNLISQIVIWPFVKRYVNYSKISIKDIIKHIKPNLILFVPVIAISIYKILDKIMLGAMTNVTEVGFYESSEKIINIPMAIITSLGTVMLPKMSNLVKNEDNKSSSKYMYISILVAMFTSSSLSFGIMGVSNEFVPLFFGNGFEPCIDLFKLLLPICIFTAFANVIRTQYLIPNKKDKIYIVSVFLGAVVNVCINYLLIPKFQANGAAIGTFFAEISVCIYQTYKVRYDVPVKKYMLEAIPFMFSGIIMYMILIKISFNNMGLLENLVLKILIGAVIYFITLGICLICLISYKKREDRLN